MQLLYYYLINKPITISIHRQINQLIVLSIMDVIIIIYHLQKLTPSHRFDYYLILYDRFGLTLNESAVSTWVTKDVAASSLYIRSRDNFFRNCSIIFYLYYFDYNHYHLITGCDRYQYRYHHHYHIILVVIDIDTVILIIIILIKSRWLVINYSSTDHWLIDQSLQLLLLIISER